VVDGVAGPNGLGFSPDATTLYFTDSWAHEIAAFTYDRRSGALSDRAVFASLRNDSGFPIPDGLTVDADGGVWSARFGDDVVRYAPDGRVTRRVSLPTTTVTSLGFGGPDYGSLYATTGSDNFGTLEDIGEHAGALFRITVSGIRGRPEFRSRIRI
jgi:D-xylonolactonase